MLPRATTMALLLSLALVASAPSALALPGTGERVTRLAPAEAPDPHGPIIPPPPADNVRRSQDGRITGSIGIANLPGATSSSPPRTTPGGAGRPAAAPGGGTTGLRKKGGSTSARWSDWWSLNREAYANVRRAYHDGVGRTTPSSQGEPRDFRPSRAQIVAHVLPFLLRIVGEERDLAGSALLAAARVSSPETSADVVASILDYLDDVGAPGRELAILALGVTGDPAAVKPLVDLVRANRSGRKIVAKSSRVPTRYRSLAAVALGLVPAAGSAELLIATLSDDGASSADLEAACVTGLGLLGRDGAYASVVVPYLVEHLNDASWSTFAKARVPLALAHTGDRSSIPHLAKLLADASAPAEVRRSAALALGRLGDGLEPDVVRPLLARAAADQDGAVRQFAIVALGDLAARDGDRADGESKERRAFLDEVAQTYAQALAGEAKQRTDRPWYALSAALFARRHHAYQAAIRDRLTALISDGASVDERAAGALGLGLIGGETSRQALRDVVESTENPQVRGYAIEGLGMLGDVEFKDELLALSRTEPQDWLRFQSAIGLAWLADATTVPGLVKSIESTRSDPVQAALLLAVGKVGDGRAMATLTALAADTTRAPIARQRALDALAMLGEAGELTWNHDLRWGYNFTAATPTIADIVALY